MAIRKRYKVGQIYAIDVTPTKYTVGQLIYYHKLPRGEASATFAFYGYLFSSVDEAREKAPSLDYTKPIAVDTVTELPHELKWKYLDYKAPVDVGFDFKKDISRWGEYKDCSLYPWLYLYPYFGVWPWDYTGREDFIDKQLLPNTSRPKYTRFAKDFSTEELKCVMPSDSYILIQRLKEEAEAEALKERE